MTFTFWPPQKAKVNEMSESQMLRDLVPLLGAIHLIMMDVFFGLFLRPRHCSTFSSSTKTRRTRSLASSATPSSSVASVSPAKSKSTNAPELDVLSLSRMRSLISLPPSSEQGQKKRVFPFFRRSHDTDCLPPCLISSGLVLGWPRRFRFRRSNFDVC